MNLLSNLGANVKSLLTNGAAIKLFALQGLTMLVQHAEAAIPGNGTGASKLAWVVNAVESIVAKLPIPAFLQPLVKHALDSVLPALVAEIVAEAKAQGLTLLGNSPTPSAS